jgi:hypothetical protein
LTVDVLAEGFDPPAGLDPVEMLEEHLAVGWEYSAEVIIDAPCDAVASRVPRVLGRVEPASDHTCRLVGTTSNPWWYAEQLAALPADFRIIGGPELRHTARVLGARLLAAGAEEAGSGGQ